MLLKICCYKQLALILQIPDFVKCKDDLLKVSKVKKIIFILVKKLILSFYKHKVDA